MVTSTKKNVLAPALWQKIVLPCIPSEKSPKTFEGELGVDKYGNRPCGYQIQEAFMDVHEVNSLKDWRNTSLYPKEELGFKLLLYY